MDLFKFSSKRTERSDPASGVLFLSSGGLGDTVLLAHVFDRFRQVAQTGEKISLLLRKDAAKMAFLFGDDIAIEVVDFNKLRKSRKYRNDIFDGLYVANYRQVVSLDYLRHPKLDERLIQACSASETIAMEPRSWAKYDKLLNENRKFYNRLYNSGPVHLDKVVRWGQFADWLTGTTELPAKIGLPDALKPEPAALPRPAIVLIPFSAVKEKQSPAETYSQIIDSAPEGYDFVVAGAPDDLSKNPSFQPIMERENVYYDDSTFVELAPILRAADLVISVDTATMHLAAAMGAPTLCLASAAYVGEIVPYAPEITPDNVHFVYENMDCAGCLGNCHLAPEDGMYPCVARLNLLMVLAKMATLLPAEKTS